MVLGHKCGAYVADKTVEHPRAHILSVTGGLRYLRHPGGGGGLWKDSPALLMPKGSHSLALFWPQGQAVSFHLDKGATLKRLHHPGCSHA